MVKLEDKIKQELKNIQPTKKWEVLGLFAVKDIAVIFVWLLSVFLIGIVFNIIFNFSQWQSLFFGAHFNLSGLLVFPIELLVILIALILLQYFLIQRVHLIYRWPKIYTFALIVLMLVIGFSLAEFSGVNNFMARRPGINALYKNEGRFINRGNTIIKGKIVSFTATELKLIDEFGREKSFTLNNFSKISPELQVGQNVRLVVTRDGQLNVVVHVCAIGPDSFGCHGQGLPKKCTNSCNGL